MWKILGIDPTTDIKVIKTAYAKLAKQYNPEENPEEFQRIHEAYRQASAFAKQGGNPRKNTPSGDGIDFTALGKPAEKIEFDFSNVDENKRRDERKTPADVNAPKEPKDEFVFPAFEQKREHFSEKADNDFDFSNIDINRMEMSDEERLEKDRTEILRQISELLSDKKRINNYDEWNAIFSSPEFAQTVNDPEFRVDAASLLMFRILTKEVAELGVKSFGGSSELIRINSLVNEWEIGVDYGDIPVRKPKKIPRRRGLNTLSPGAKRIVIGVAVLFLTANVMDLMFSLSIKQSSSENVPNISYEQPQGVVTLREYKEGEDAAEYLMDAYIEIINETSFTAEDLYKIFMGKWETARGNITFLEDQSMIIEKDGKCYSGTVDITPAEKGVELSMVFHTDDEFYDNATATAKLFQPKGIAMVIVTADGMIHPSKFLPEEDDVSP